MQIIWMLITWKSSSKKTDSALICQRFVIVNKAACFQFLLCFCMGRLHQWDEDSIAFARMSELADCLKMNWRFCNGNIEVSLSVCLCTVNGWWMRLFDVFKSYLDGIWMKLVGFCFKFIRPQLPVWSITAKWTPSFYCSMNVIWI